MSDAPMPDLTAKQVSALQAVLRFEEIKALTRHTGTIDATSRRPDVESPAVDAIHINVARSLETKGLVTLTRIPAVRGLYAEDAYTNVNLTPEGRKVACRYRLPLPVNVHHIRVTPSVELRLAAMKLRELAKRLDTTNIRSALPVIELARQVNTALAGE